MLEHYCNITHPKYICCKFVLLVDFHDTIISHTFVKLQATNRENKSCLLSCLYLKNEKSELFLSESHLCWKRWFKWLLLFSDHRGLSSPLCWWFSAWFLSLLLTRQCSVWMDLSIFHHQSNHIKNIVCPVNNPMAISFFFTHVQVLIPLSWNFDFLFDP